MGDLKGEGECWGLAEEAIWITWERQVRNRSMARALGVRLLELACDGSRPRRYLHGTFLTLRALLRERPGVVFAQNPSVVLTCLLLAFRGVFRYRFVSDAHFAGLMSCNGSRIMQKLLDRCNRAADLVIVTNAGHAAYVKALGGEALVCEDPLPQLGGHEAANLEGGKSVLYICSWDSDEPYQAAFEAAQLLAGEGFTFCVTGNFRKAGIDPDDYPWVTFLGYLPEADFHARLFACDVVLDLTENENCLVCGAYEAMSAEKPLVTSDTECLRSYFAKGTIVTGHHGADIADAVQRAYGNREMLKWQIRAWKREITALQEERLARIRLALSAEAAVSPVRQRNVNP